MLLKMKSDYSKLGKLVHDLLNTDPTRPEVFVALSVMWERKDDKGALSYAEKVVLFTFRFGLVVSFYGTSQSLLIVVRAFKSMRDTYLAI